VTPPAAAPERGDLVWLDFDPRIGHEQAGHRPAFVLSPRSYNVRAGLALVCPITSKAKGYPYEVPLPPGLKATGVVLADQIRSIDWIARRPRRMDRAPANVVADVLAKASTLLA
jgi:mRNA interferase MazF